MSCERPFTVAPFEKSEFVEMARRFVIDCVAGDCWKGLYDHVSFVSWTSTYGDRSQLGAHVFLPIRVTVFLSKTLLPKLLASVKVPFKVYIWLYLSYSAGWSVYRGSPCPMM